MLALDSALGERKAKVARLIDRRLTGIAGWASLGSTRGCPFPDRPACAWKASSRECHVRELAKKKPRANRAKSKEESLSLPQRPISLVA